MLRRGDGCRPGGIALAKKIPVGDTISEAYDFTFGHLGVIIGLIWLPVALVAVGTFFANMFYGAALASALSEGRIAAQGQAEIAMFGWLLLAFLLDSIAIAAVVKQALGLRKGPAFIHFALGKAEFRTFGVLLGFVIIMVLFYFFYMLLLGVLVSLMKGHGPGASVLALAGAVTLLGGLAALCYIAVRLSFLMFPATVAEDKGGLARSWILTRGNFWRIFLIGLATLLPLMLINSLAEYMILGPQFYTNTWLAAFANEAVQKTLEAENRRIMAAHLPLMSGLSLVLAPFLAGLALAPSAFAYRALTRPDAPPPA
jgi:hypothetical protein